MNRKSLTIIAVVVLLAAAASVYAATKYFYLGNDLNTEITLSKGELAALQLTAYYNNTGALTGKLMRQGVRAMLGPMSLDVLVDTVAQESWPVHAGGTEFSISDGELMLAYMEAGEIVLGWIGRYFPGIDPRAVNIVFTIKGYMVGSYQQGKFTLKKQ